MKKANRIKSRTSRNKSLLSENRLIFPYWDGERERRVDPLEIQAKLTSIDGFDLETDTKLMVGASPFAQEALNRVVAAIRTAFDVQPYSQGPPERGLTRGECMQLLVAFGLFIEDLKKKFGGLPTSPNSTDSPTSGDDSRTPNSSASSPVSPGPPPADQSTPQPPSPSPSAPECPAPGTNP